MAGLGQNLAAAIDQDRLHSDTVGALVGEHILDAGSGLVVNARR